MDTKSWFPLRDCHAVKALPPVDSLTPNNVDATLLEIPVRNMKSAKKRPVVPPNFLLRLTTLVPSTCKLDAFSACAL